MANMRLPFSTSSVDKVLRDIRLKGRGDELKPSLFARELREENSLEIVAAFKSLV